MGDEGAKTTDTKEGKRGILFMNGEGSPFAL